MRVGNYRRLVSRGTGRYGHRGCFVRRLQPGWKIDGHISQNRRPDSLQLSDQTKRTMGRRKDAGEWRTLFLRTWIKLHDLCVQQPENKSRDSVGTGGDSDRIGGD